MRLSKGYIVCIVFMLYTPVLCPMDREKLAGYQAISFEDDDAVSSRSSAAGSDRFAPSATQDLPLTSVVQKDGRVPHLIDKLEELWREEEQLEPVTRSGRKAQRVQKIKPERQALLYVAQALQQSAEAQAVQAQAAAERVRILEEQHKAAQDGAKNKERRENLHLCATCGALTISAVTCFAHLFGM